MQRGWWIASLLVVLMVNLATAADKAARYGAMLANGRRLEGQTLSDWHVSPPQAAPKLDAVALLDPAQPLRWLRDRSVVYTAPPAAYVETTTGDRLPGNVLSYDDGSSTPFDARGPFFFVRPDVPFQSPAPVADFKVRVLASYVRRIVWQRRPGPPPAAGMAFFRDGRQQAFRAARFSAEGVSLLTDEGPRRALFGELAELSLPSANRWDALLDELAVLAPSGAGRLLQFETIDGLVATASLDRFRCHPYGAPQDTSRWLHGIQPAWSLDVLWVLHPRIAVRRMWSAEEMPLSRVQPAAARHRALVGAAGQTARVNRNVLDGPLHSGNQDFGWGFGVQSQSQLEFELPPLASAFRAYVGLDRSAGSGGCIRARVYVNGLDKAAAFDSGFLVGSGVVSETGVVSLTANGQPAAKLILEIDAAHDGRPAGADPFDIRDQANWLDPLVLFDPGRLQVELTRRSRQQLAAWYGWQLWLDTTPAAPEQRGSLQWLTSWNELASPPGSFQTGVAAVQRGLVLRKSLKVGPRDHWLVVATSQPVASNPPPKIEVRINGDLAAEQPVPVRNGGQRDPPPIAVPLAPYVDQTIDVEIVQSPSPAPAAGAPPQVVHWRTLGVYEHLPTLYRIFDEESEPKLVSETGEGVVEVIQQGAFVGRRALKLTPAALWQLNLRAPVPVRDQPAWGEYRYLRFGVRKEGEGRFALQFDTAEPREKPARLDGGQGPPALEGAVRVYQAKLPEQWLPLPHDLFASFGRFDLSGLRLSAVDGRSVSYDAIYLARTLADFEQIGRDREPPLPDKPVQDGLAAVAVAKATPTLVTLEAADGRRACGSIISADGDVLTTARFVVAPNLPIKVRLADGRLVNGQTRGLARELDLALVKIAKGAPFAVVELDPVAVLPTDRPYAIAQREAAEKPVPPVTSVTMLRRTSRGTLWIGQSVEKLSAGSPLFDANGRLMGVASHPHGDRWQFARTFDAIPLLPRLRNGEVVGNWPGSLAPNLDVRWKPHPAGAEVESLAAGSPAAAAGLKKGDVLIRLDGQSVDDPRAVAEILAAKNPGQEVGLDLADGRAVRIRLAP